MCGNLRFALRFCVLSPFLYSPTPSFAVPLQLHSDALPGKPRTLTIKRESKGGKKGKPPRQIYEKNTIICRAKSVFFRLSSSYLYFFHILTIMCCQNKIFPRLRPFPVEHTGGVSSCSTGKRKPADHGRRVSSLPAKYSWISRKRDGEENVGQRGAPHTVIPVPTSVKDSESSVLPVCTFENTRRPSAVVPPGHKSHSFAQVRLIVNILSTKCCIS